MVVEKNTPRIAVVLAALVVAEILSTFELTLILAATGAMLKEFQDPTTVAWILTAFTLVAASVVTICGRLGDLWGRRNVLLAVIALAAIGSTISALSTSLTGVIIGRVIQGFSAAILPLCFGLVREHLPTEKVAMGNGVVIVTANVTAAIAYVMGGYIVDHFSWHGIFYASAIVAFVALFTTWKLLPPGRTVPSQGRFDYPGAVLFVPAVFLILLALSRWNQWGGIANPLLWALLAGGSLTIAFWARHELRHAHPLINVRLLGNRQIMLTILFLGLMCGGAMSYGIIFPMYLTQPTWNIPAGGLSSTAAASVLFPSVLLGGLGALFMAPLVRRIGSRNTLITASLLLVTAWTTLALHHDSAWLIGLLLVPQSMGMAMTLALVPVLLSEVVPLDHTSEVNGLSSLFRQIGVSIGSILVGLVLKASGGHGAASSGSHPPPEAFGDAIWLVACILMVCLACALALPRKATRINLAAESA
jgi:MFS family permease